MGQALVIKAAQSKFKAAIKLNDLSPEELIEVNKGNLFELSFWIA